MSEEFTLSEETEESESSFFVVVSPDFEFAESSWEVDEEGKSQFSVKVLATVLELEKPSSNGRLYQFSEGQSIADSLVGKPIYYGIDFLGHHNNPLMRATSENSPCGIVERAFVEGQKIKAKLKITLPSLVEKIRSGLKFLFSVGGHAITESLTKIGGKMVHILQGARCNHLQIVDSNVKVGFPNAKMERVLDFGETVLFIESEEGEEIILEEEKKPEKLEPTEEGFKEEMRVLDEKILKDKEIENLRREKIETESDIVKQRLENEEFNLKNKRIQIGIRHLITGNEQLNREVLAEEKEEEKLELEVFGKLLTLPEGEKKERIKKEIKEELEQLKNEDEEDSEEDEEIELSESEDDSYVLE